MQYQYLPSDQAQLQVEQEDIKRRQQMAQAFQQAGFNPVQGGNQALTLLASLASTLRGNSMMKDSSKSLSENLAKQFEMQSQADQAKAEAEQRKRDEDFQRELQKIDFGNKSSAQYRAPSNIDPNSPEGIAARLSFEKGKAGLQPKSGPAQPQFAQQLQALKAMGIELSPEELKQVVAGIKPEAGAKPKEANPKIAAAQQAMEVLAQLEDKIKSGKTWTGPIDKFLPGEGQQSFEAGVNSLVNPLQTLTRIPGQGAQSDMELKQLMASFPNLGNRENVNMESIQRLRDYITKNQAQMGDEVAQGQPPSSTPPTGAQQEYPDGTVIQNAQGQKMVMQAGQWVPA